MKWLAPAVCEMKEIAIISASVTLFATITNYKTVINRLQWW